ncbi:transcription factor IIA, alpha/beta subunit [Neohortaea acidophila]|uniref:Transcription factor IIA, alpha/beta subunit n=1 Tax=Neohortaea acidophila TaxID=245834 RepID=A0A6A6PUJ2_9PEZI|nr:transcription factor IIA, alpha/beta subunit [Neohortaea acidophila]KAF2483778.1 transcription factor IIA, alpha/beta subunit [Neohortaea acidophila]
MTNTLVGDVYAKIIEEVVQASSTDFEESGVSQLTLQELQKEWQSKLSQRNVAHMPWDPKAQPAPALPPSLPTPTANGVPPSSYPAYDTPSSTATATNGARVKTEGAAESPYNGHPNGYSQDTGPTQGGLARAQHLVQQQYGPNASASLSAMQRAGGGLALPGQQQQSGKPQGLHLPGGTSSPGTPQFTLQQQQAMMRHQQQMMQQQQQQQQQNQPRIKVENDSPQLAQGAFPQQAAQPNYSQTDGADDDAHTQWQTLLAERRAISAEQRNEADRQIRDQVMQHSSELQSGLMVPLDEQPSSKKRKLQTKRPTISASAPSIPQLDGVDDDEDDKDIKDEDDENAINSDLDDSDEEGQGDLGEEDDETGENQILCTYDKVQRVKNKWKCVLKDGVMSSGGKEWVFHKGNGEFEW